MTKEGISLDVPEAGSEQERVEEEIFESAESIERSIGASMKVHLAESKKKGSADVRRVVNLWKDFSNNLFNRLSSENLRDPQKVEAALELANALLQVEPTREGEVAVRNGIEALRERYGV